VEVRNFKVFKVVKVLVMDFKKIIGKSKNAQTFYGNSKHYLEALGRV
jgi:hypothetical protein